MNSSIYFFTVLIGIFIGIFLGMLISKINYNLSWKQVLLIKFKVLIIAPLINIISNCIVKKKKSLGQLYRIRNNLMDILTNGI